MSFIKKVLKYYSKIPIGILNFFAPIYHLLPDSVRFTPIFTNEMREIERIHSLSGEQIRQEKLERLKKLVRYAYEHTQYYRELFQREGIKPDDIQSIEDMERIPFLTKDLLRENRDKMISDEFKSDDLIYITTSGSTGAPTGFYVQKDSHLRDLAYGYFFFREYGYTTRCSKLVLRGKVFISQRKGKCFQWDAFKKELSINIFEMTDKNMEAYCRAIEKYKPDVAFGYMSAMYVLCKYISNRPNTLKHQFKCFLGISENISDEQREFVENVIQAPVLTLYGMSERVIIAMQSPDTREYIPEPLYGITELVDEKGNVIKESNADGELVGTSLLNYGMPLIRYKTGDISSWSKAGRLSGISGRWNHDLLVGKDHCAVSMTALNMHSEVFKKVVRYQLVQDEAGKVDINIVPTEQFDRNDGKEIERQFNEKAKGQIVFTVKIVAQIDPKANGKLFLVDQHLDLEKELEGIRS